MKRWTWGQKRFGALTGAFMLLLLAPLLNFYWNINFIQGWYQSIGIGDLWIVSPLEGLESLLVTRTAFGPLLTSLILPVLLAATLGRVFCSWVCPITFLSELGERVIKLVSHKTAPEERWKAARQLLWISLALELLISLVLGAPVFVFLSPPGLVGRELMTLVFFHSATLEGMMILLALGLNLLSRRFYCRYLCPLGACLALIGLRRKLRLINVKKGCRNCGTCNHACPMGLKPSHGEGSTAYCWNCGSCIDNCHFNQLRFTLNAHVPEPKTDQGTRSS